MSGLWDVLVLGKNCSVRITTAKATSDLLTCCSVCFQFDVQLWYDNSVLLTEEVASCRKQNCWLLQYTLLLACGLK
jgi:hypothetical protein